MPIRASNEGQVLGVSDREIVDDLAGQARHLSQDSDPQALIAWGSELVEHQNTPELSAVLFQRLGPEETARLLRLTAFAADRSQSYPDEMEATLDALKTTLASGSTRMDDASDFANELGCWLLPTELSDEENAELVANGGLPLAGLAALAQILRGTSFGPDFLAGLAERVEHFERSGAADPAEYYQLMTPARFDDYQARNISALLAEQRARHS
jgi:hypothetical protein